MEIGFINLAEPLVSLSAAKVIGRRRASVFILCLWSLCILSSFAVILGYQLRQKLSLVGRLEERAKSRYLGEAGIKLSLPKIKAMEPKDYYAQDAGLNNNPGIFRDMVVGDGRVSICYNYFNERTGLPELRYGIADEESKININTCGIEIMERLFTLLLGDNTESQELAAAVLDWRDADSQLSNPGSAEGQYYRGQEYPYEAKDSNFQVLRELLLVKGMNEDNFGKLEYFITIYGDGGVNINTASKPVLLAIGISEILADKVLSYRYGSDGIEATSDDNFFDTVYNIMPKLKEVFQLSAAEIANLEAVAQQSLTTSSDNFTIRSIANLNNRKNTSESICVTDRQGRILYWQES